MRFKGTVPLLFFITGLVGSQGALAEDCLQYGGYTHWAGSLAFQDGAEIIDLAVSGNTAYCLAKLYGQASLRVMDITNATAPILLGSYSWASAQPSAIALSGAVAYVADGTAGIKLVDVSDPTAPALISQVGSPLASSFDVAVSGAFVYVADGNQGLRIVNVSDRVHPVVAGGVDTPGMAIGIAEAGTLVYIADYSFSGLQIVDVSNPNAPVLVGSVVTPGSAKDVFVSNSLAYVADGERGLQIIDISNPNSPAILGAMPTPPDDEVSGVWVTGSTAFVAASSGLLVVNVSIPFFPMIADHMATSGSATKVVHDGSTVFVKIGGAGCDKFYISPLHTPSFVGAFHHQWVDGPIEVSGSVAYLPGDTLLLVDVSDPASPQQLGSLALAPWCSDVAVSGSMAYLSSYFGNNYGLTVVDASVPQQPVITSSVVDSLGYQTGGIAVSGSVVYLANYGRGLRVFDVSNPTQPINIGNLQVPCSNVTVSGTWAYLADGDYVVVVDVTDPTLPQDVGWVTLPSRVLDIARSGSFLCVGTETSGMAVIDISNPASPAIVNELAVPGSVYGMSVSGTYAYMATYSSAGMVVIDISEPSSPKIVGNIDGAFWAISVSGSFIYLSAGADLLIAPIQCEATTAVLPDLQENQPLLGLAYPNPARGASVIPFALPRAGTVTLCVYDLAGRQVRTLVNEPMQEGPHSVVWDGRNQAGTQLPAGIYFFQLTAPGFEASQKVVRIE